MVLENQYLLKLRRLLLCDYLYIISFLIILLIGIIFTNFNKNSIYNENINQITGKVTWIEKENEYYKIELKAKEKIIVYYKKENNIKVGNELRLEGEFERPKNNTIPNGFNYKKYLYTIKTYWIFNANNIEITNNKSNFKQKVIHQIEKSDKSKEYLYTFILGKKNQISDDLLKSYQSNGIIHLFAISGMHIGLISIILISILKKIKIKEIERYIIVSIILFLYMIFLESTPSIFRAVTFFILVSINKMFYLNIKPVNLLLISASIALIFNMYLIYNIAFLFSYSITFFILVFIEKIKGSKIKKLLVLSSLSFLSSLPIVTNNFYEINFLSIINNMVFVPVVTTILFPLSLITFFIPLLDNVLSFLINMFEYFSLLASKINILKLAIPKMPMALTIFYYIVIFILLKKKNIIKTLIIVTVFLLLYSNINYIRNNPYIINIDVGQGDSTLIHLEYNKLNLLIDSGGSYYNKNFSAVARNTIPMLKSLGIKKINYLITTHGDYDHCGEVINLINNFKIEVLVINNNEANKLEETIIKAAKEKNVKIIRLNKNMLIKYRNSKIELIELSVDSDENKSSIVAYATINDKKILLTGDLPKEEEERLVKEYNIKDIDIIKIGHHGSNTSTSLKYIKTAKPKIAVISVGLNNKFGHPTKEVLKTLEDSKIYKTSNDGSILFNIKNQILIKTYPP